MFILKDKTPIHTLIKKTHEMSVFSWVNLMPEMSEAAVSPAAYFDQYQEVEGEAMDSNPVEAFFMAVLWPLLYEWWFKNKMRVFENICVCVYAGQVIFVFVFCSVKHEGVPLCYCSLVCPFSSSFFFCSCFLQINMILNPCCHTPCWWSDRILKF